jgi:murein DD-endopeptidase MepM/ murein hydrolase activator NlpD
LCAALLAFQRLLVSASLLTGAALTSPVTTSFAHPMSGDPLLDTLVVVPRFHAMWPTVGVITTYFGDVGPLSPRGHTGLDIAAPEDTRIVAADEGEVLKAYWSDDGYGGLVIIGHPSGYETWYAHLDEFKVQKGQHVHRGQTIALMGTTGYSTGPHLHFEVHEDGELRDPLEYLSEANLKPANW